MPGMRVFKHSERRSGNSNHSAHSSWTCGKYYYLLRNSLYDGPEWDNLVTSLNGLEQLSSVKVLFPKIQRFYPNK